MITDRSGVETPGEEAGWAEARAQAAAQREFFVHAVTYVLVCTFLVVIDVGGGSTGDTFVGLDWAFWPIGGWLLGLASHAVWVFGFGHGWEERRAARLHEQRERHQSRPF